MKLKIIDDNDMLQNIYIYYDNKTGEGVIIDPGHNTEEIVDEIEDLNIKGILLTHGHYDHITKAKKIKNLTSSIICCHRLEENMLKNADINLSSKRKGKEPISLVPDKLFEDGEEFAFADTCFKVIHVPGHTGGCVSYYDEKNGVLFTGDTLFRESVGRTDLPESDRSLITPSIKDKLFTLPDDTKVYPGHGQPTTIGYEKAHNKYV